MSESMGLTTTSSSLNTMATASGLFDQMEYSSTDSSAASAAAAASVDESSGYYTLVESILIAVIAGILSFVTIAGNVLVMVSFKLDKQLQTISNYFLLSLAGKHISLIIDTSSRHERWE
jgi:muscarinic acetylcholine receptor M3